MPLPTRECSRIARCNHPYSDAGGAPYSFSGSQPVGPEIHSVRDDQEEVLA